MHKTVEAILDKDGRLRFLQKVSLSHVRRVLVTFLEDEGDAGEAEDTALLSETTLSTDWDRPEEDEAWRHLQ